MCTIGYYADVVAAKAAATTTPEPGTQERLRSDLHMLTFAGPVCMAVGCFAMIVSCVTVCETRDRLIKAMVAAEIEKAKLAPATPLQPGCCERTMRRLVDKYKAQKQRHRLGGRRSGRAGPAATIGEALKTVPRDIFSIDMGETRATSLIPLPETESLIDVSDIEFSCSAESLDGVAGSGAGRPVLRSLLPWECGGSERGQHRPTALKSILRPYGRTGAGGGGGGSEYGGSYSSTDHCCGSLPGYSGGSGQWSASSTGGGRCNVEIDFVDWETISVCADSTAVVANSLESTIDTRAMFLSIGVRDSTSPLLATSATSEIGCPGRERGVIVHQASVHEEDVISVHADDSALHGRPTNPDQNRHSPSETGSQYSSASAVFAESRYSEVSASLLVADGAVPVVDVIFTMSPPDGASGALPAPHDPDDRLASTRDAGSHYTHAGRAAGRSKDSGLLGYTLEEVPRASTSSLPIGETRTPCDARPSGSCGQLHDATWRTEDAPPHHRVSYSDASAKLHVERVANGPIANTHLNRHVYRSDMNEVSDIVMGSRRNDGGTARLSAMRRHGQELTSSAPGGDSAILFS